MSYSKLNNDLCQFQDELMIKIKNINDYELLKKSFKYHYDIVQTNIKNQTNEMNNTKKNLIHLYISEYMTTNDKNLKNERYVVSNNEMIQFERQKNIKINLKNNYKYIESLKILMRKLNIDENILD